MSHRLYLADLGAEGKDPAGRQHTLNRDQSHYLLRVLRLKPGAEVYCFDGQGHEWAATVSSVERRGCTIDMAQLVRERSPTSAPITLAISWLKGAAMDTVVQKATELGVDQIIILRTERSNVSLDDKREANKLQHWRGIAISACEQSGRLFIPQITPPVDLADFLTTMKSAQRILLDLGSPPLDAGNTPRATTLLVGPEGGWSDAERALFRAHEIPSAGLGELTLRAETAPLAALAAIRHGWRWQSEIR
jgi:16S rRNA (uracil1498-N3)-methyltransferase